MENNRLVRRIFETRKVGRRSKGKPKVIFEKKLAYKWGEGKQLMDDRKNWRKL